MRILIVENKDQQSTLHARLRSRGIACDVASSQATAMRLHERTPYHAVFVDLESPLVNGPKFIPEMRRVSPSAKVVPVSADDDDGVIEQLFKRGAAAYLLKPVSDLGLFAIVDALQIEALV